MRSLAVLLLLSACATAPVPPAAPAEPVIAIVGPVVIDGSGAPAFVTTAVLIRGDRIDAVGPRSIPAGATIVDGHGLTLAPGFIDMHNHSGRGLERDPSATSQVSQGITTLALGQDGGSELPIADYLGKLEAAPVAVNVLTFVGQATVRDLAMKGDLGRAATPGEIAAMVGTVDQAMRDGAFGLSTGLEYEAAKESSTEEIIALARATAPYGGIYISHVRDEAQRTFPSFEEALRIGREAKVPVQISHIKMGSKSVWGRAGDAVRLIENARAAGQDVTADAYPYDAWHATIRVLVPSGRHDDPKDVAEAIDENGGADRITIVNCSAHPGYEFKTLEQIAAEQHTTPVDVYMQVVRDGGATVIGQSMKEEDIRVFYSQPWVMVGSDGGIGLRHPRGAGTYPRILGRYVRELHWLPLEEAIRKMTSLPAARLRLTDRGLVKAGMKADLVLFDPSRVIDQSTFQDPQRLAQGIERVFVNGVEVWRDGAVTAAKPGRPIRIQDARGRSEPR
ncbi:MAG TPA: D-aminoacylase [Thermoanaerobaculia bacterium]|nr:D-aminoacylase [Thermoanaerobaculia bacterium]